MLRHLDFSLFWRFQGTGSWVIFMWWSGLMRFLVVKESGGDGDFQALVADSWPNHSTRHGGPLVEPTRICAISKWLVAWPNEATLKEIFAYAKKVLNRMQSPLATAIRHRSRSWKLELGTWNYWRTFERRENSFIARSLYLGHWPFLVLYFSGVARGRAAEALDSKLLTLLYARGRRHFIVTFEYWYWQLSTIE